MPPSSASWSSVSSSSTLGLRAAPTSPRQEPSSDSSSSTVGERPAEGDEEPQPHGRTSRTASLVSGLLIELYSCTEEDEVAAGGDRASRGRPPRSDSLDSSTETSGSDVFLGGRGVGDSRVLQELRERPSLRLQMQYLRQKDSSELKTILRELKYRIGIQSAKLLRQLKQKDRLLHKVQKNCDIVTACLQAVSQKRSESWVWGVCPSFAAFVGSEAAADPALR
uniref:TBC1 domain family member 30-like n=1 Tax=Myodes glareolus TaxID=447135 RepID=UPI0020223F99|nr:TBC1 domain family member 30-like [Myodes glareolus]